MESWKAATNAEVGLDESRLSAVGGKASAASVLANSRDRSKTP